MTQKTLHKWRQVAHEEIFGLNPQLLLAQLLTAPIPNFAGGRFRALALRLAGFHLGKGVIIYGMPTFTGGPGLHHRLIVGSYSILSIKCFLDLKANITIGDWVGIGPETMLLTGAHHIGSEYNRLGKIDPQPVVIGNGVWVGARSLIMPGVTIGNGAVVAAGAVVTRSVEDNCLVAGIPARVIRHLDADTRNNDDQIRAVKQAIKE